MTRTRSAQVDAAEIAAVIVYAFLNYNNVFRKVTRRAKKRFEMRDWSNNQNDAVERIDLDEDSVGRIVTVVKESLADRLHDKSLWALIREQYSHQIWDYADSEFFKTYFSPVTRRVFSTIGVDPVVEFIALDVTPTEHMHNMVNSKIYRNRGETQFLLTSYWLITHLLHLTETLIKPFALSVRKSMPTAKREKAATIFSK